MSSKFSFVFAEPPECWPVFFSDVIPFAGRYIDCDKDVVVAYCGTNQTADPKMKPLPCRIIARTFF
jgi:hypothetical protein